MEISEVAVWSAMVGGLVTLTALSVADVVSSRNLESFRNLVFVFVAALACVMVSGLPDELWPDLPERAMLTFKSALIPVSGAVALKFLDNWLGGKEEDLLMHRATSWGSGALLLSALVVTVLASQVSSDAFNRVRAATAVFCLGAAVVAIVATVRAVTLGDPLARWMVLASGFMMVVVTGLTLRALHVSGFGVGTWILTAVCTVIFFLIVTALAFVRARQHRRLAHLATLRVGTDAATGLPTGSVLLSEVEHAFWRTARMNGECTVVCLHLSNLYELGDAAGHSVENQILAAMAARVRRAAGFRCVVGLYHPLCFVVVILANKRRDYVNLTVTRLRVLVSDPLTVTGQDLSEHEFTPRLGVGVVTVDPGATVPVDAISEAERQALVQQKRIRRPRQDAASTVW